MFTEKQLREWQARSAEQNAAQASEVRGQVAAEVDAALTAGQRARERESAGDWARNVYRHRDLLRETQCRASTRTPEQEAQRRTEIRQQVEREVDAMLLQRRIG